MKRTISIILAVILLITATMPAFAEAEYINLEDVPYEEVFFPPWFTSGGLPYTLELYCVWLVYCNIFARFAE